MRLKFVSVTLQVSLTSESTGENDNEKCTERRKRETCFTLMRKCEAESVNRTRNLPSHSSINLQRMVKEEEEEEEEDSLFFLLHSRLFIDTGKKLYVNLLA